ncbi:MAG: cytidine deaminase [Planctomycetota bacterium]
MASEDDHGARTGDAELLDAARAVRSNAYAKASGFLVGAAIRSDDGRLFDGCNVENASYGLTICAERAAICAAVAAGARRIVAVAVVTDLDDPARPCGACRQVLAEFGASMRVVLGGRGDRVVDTTLDRLLPEPFTFDGPLLPPADAGSD